MSDPATQLIRPFADQGNWTAVHNSVFDVMMPALPPNAFKVLCFVIRKTRGWKKDSDKLSYSQIAAGTGIKSPGTLSAAIKVLTDGGHIIGTSSEKWQPTSYQLNTAFELEVPTTKIEVDSTTTEIEATTEIIVAPTTEIVALPTTKIVDTKESIKETVNKESVRKTRTPRTPKQGSLDSLHEACQIAKRAIGKNLTPVQATTIAETVIDIEHWRAVVTAWGNRYGTMNVDGMIDWYLHPDKMRRNGDRSSSNGKPLRQHSRPDFERANWKEGSIDDAI